MNVPLLDLPAQYNSIKKEVAESINKVLEAQHFIMGDTVKEFEKQVENHCETEHAFGCASGSDALLLALMATDIQPGDYIITTPFTFFAAAGAISRLGAIPIFIDIQPDSFNIDPTKIRAFMEGRNQLSKKINPNQKKIKAIIPVHLYGQSADMQPILELAKEFDLKVIEDAAQSIGARYKNEQVGNLGDFGCFSFFPSKNLGAYGDAGLITVKDPELAAKVDILRLHGAQPKYHHKYVGINSRLDALQAAILSVKLKYLESWSDRRREIAHTYNELFSESGITSDNPAFFSDCSFLENQGCELANNKIILPKETTGNVSSGGRHIYHQYTLRVQNREFVQEELKRDGIGTAVYYPLSLHIQECFKHLGYKSEDLPISLRASSQALSIPIYPELSDKQIKFVVNTLTKVLN